MNTITFCEDATKMVTSSDDKKVLVSCEISRMAANTTTIIQFLIDLQISYFAFIHINARYGSGTLVYLLNIYRVSIYFSCWL